MKTFWPKQFFPTALCLLLIHAPVFAQTSAGSEQGEPEADGQQASTAAAAEEEQISAEERARREVRVAELTRQLQIRQQAIEDLQSEQGIYHPALIEAYSDLANVHVELENYDQASRYLTDALQIARINTGLFSEQQLPVIDELIKNNMRKQDWNEVDDLVHLDYHIASRVYQLEDDEYLSAADDYGQWKLRVLRENLLQQSGSGLMNTAEDLSDFYERLIASVEYSDRIESDELLKLLHGKSQADLSLARAVAQTPYTYFQGTASRFITRQRCENVRNASGQLVRQCYNVQVENPRYRQSQIDAKRFAVNRYTRAVNDVIERMMLIKNNSEALDATERQRLDTQIADLQAEAEAIRRLGYRNYRF